MDLREGQNITRPPLLEGNKYGYWRVRMKAFLKSQDESVWEAVEQGWTHPVATDEEGKVNLLAKDKWTEVQKKAEAANSKAMNAIFSGVDGKNFKMISTCEIAKTAWDILRTAHEGTTKVKISRMETVTSKFENLRMQEDETIADFNTRVLDISNEAFALGEPMTEEALVRKVLRSLTKRFAMKALAVKEANDVKTMRLDELMGSLQTHEMDMNEEDRPTKASSVGLKAEVSKDKTDDSPEQQYAMFARNFGKFMRRQYNKGTYPGQSSSSKFQKDGNTQKGNQSGDSNNDSKGKGIQCRECEGFGHIRAECVNTQKKKNAYAVSWSDSESDQEGETNNFVALASYVNIEGETSNELGSESSSENPTLYSSCSNNEEIFDEDFATKYKELFQEWLNEVEQNKMLHNNLTVLTEEKEKLWEEAAVLITQKVELQQTITELQAQVAEVKNERDDLYAQKAELLTVISSLKVQIERGQGDHPEGMSNLKKKNAALKRQEVILLNTIDALKIEIETDKEAPVKSLEDLHLSGSSSRVVPEELPPQRYAAGFRAKRQDKRRCFNCNQVGHFQSKCPDLHSPHRRMDQHHKVSRLPIKQVWKIKQRGETCLAAFSSTFFPEKQRWYFDSGCSRHMTGNPNFLTGVERFKGESVTFRDGIEGRVLGRGILNVPGLPRLTDVFLVEGLQANMISISQLCDGNNRVQFTQDKCIVQNNLNQIVLAGRRTSNNCYSVDLGLPTAMIPYKLSKDMKTSTAWGDCRNRCSVQRRLNSKGSPFESCYTKLLWKKSKLNEVNIERCYIKKLWKKSILEKYRVEQDMMKQQSDISISALNNIWFRTPRSSPDLCATNH
ncbi:unnamed protein product [Rhodiola kirilowii]